MQAKVKFLFLGIVLSTLCSCSVYKDTFVLEHQYLPPGASAQTKVKKKLSASYDQVWDASLALLEEDQMTIEVSDKDSGAIVAKKTLQSIAQHGDIVRPGIVKTSNVRIRELMKPDKSKPHSTSEEIREHGLIEKTERTVMSELRQTADYTASMQANVNILFAIAGVDTEVEVLFDTLEDLHDSTPTPNSTGSYEKAFIQKLAKKLGLTLEEEDD